MKKILNKIIINFTILIFLGSCHSIEHKNIFIKNKDFTVKVVNADKTIKSETVTKTKAKPETVTKTKAKPETVTKTKVNLQSLLNFSETQLYSKIGKGNFIKQEGQLKNIQYYFSKCFLDVFLIRRNNNYRVNFLQIRPTLLNGSIKKDECLDEISSKLKTSLN